MKEFTDEQDREVDGDGQVRFRQLYLRQHDHKT